MKVTTRAVLAAVLVLTALMASETALAHRGRVAVGVSGSAFRAIGATPPPTTIPRRILTTIPTITRHTAIRDGYPAAPTTYVSRALSPRLRGRRGQWVVSAPRPRPTIRTSGNAPAAGSGLRPPRRVARRAGAGSSATRSPDVIASARRVRDGSDRPERPRSAGDGQEPATVQH